MADLTLLGYWGTFCYSVYACILITLAPGKEWIGDITHQSTLLYEQIISAKIPIMSTILYGEYSKEFEEISKYLGNNVVVYDTAIMHPNFLCTVGTFVKLGSFEKYFSDLQQKQVLPKLSTIHTFSDDFSNIEKSLLQFIQLNKIQWKKMY